MTEEQIKFICKWIINNGNRPLSKEEKEIIKQAIDKAKNIDELAALAVVSINITEGR